MYSTEVLKSKVNEYIFDKNGKPLEDKRMQPLRIEVTNKKNGSILYIDENRNDGPCDFYKKFEFERRFIRIKNLLNYLDAVKRDLGYIKDKKENLEKVFVSETLIKYYEEIDDLIVEIENSIKNDIELIRGCRARVYACHYYLQKKENFAYDDAISAGYDEYCPESIAKNSTNGFGWNSKFVTTPLGKHKNLIRFYVYDLGAFVSKYKSSFPLKYTLFFDMHK